MRPVRKITRKVKVARRQEAINSMIRTGIEGGEHFRDIANQVSMDFHIEKDRALKMAMAEFKRTATQWMDTGEPSIKTADGQA